ACKDNFAAATCKHVKENKNCGSQKYATNCAKTCGKC
uniref:Kappa-actitoxin-Avd6a n=1 Tax=Anemonia sulcata TaxID=6108 RepID=K1B_ANESU|nr:RecName: Full=Kappa-actitoxin-Avd6a; Short=Kappa-AITX-Avd6a; AltName: Full=Kaliseptine; Short=AsKS [Anemonia sulcata]AAB35412.1 kaliseptine, AsKS [Anemonia sulcata=sea anemones, toxin, Peptide, 36 aa] [Anemonia sulcata]